MRQAFDRRAETFCPFACQFGRIVGQNDGKLLSAVAHDDVAGARGALDHLGDLAQDEISDVVSTLVVDLLEVVDIDHQQRKAGVIAVCHPCTALC